MKIDIKDFCNFQESQKSKIWDIGNNVFYDLCRKYPNHTSVDKIIAKIWLIGRTYAVAIERRKNKNKDNNKQESSDGFYVEVAEKMISSRIDEQMAKLPNTKQLNEGNIKIISNVHAFLTKIFYELTRQYKVSLASKYLHFHYPIVPIYDSRANKCIRAIFEKDENYKNMAKWIFSKATNRFEIVEKDYLSFVIKIYCLQHLIFEKTGRCYSPRDIDKYLLEKL